MKNIRGALAISTLMLGIASLLLAGCLVGDVERADILIPKSPPVSDLMDLPYGPSVGCSTGRSHELCGGSQTLDVYKSSSQSKGTIIWIHGGGFTRGDKAAFESAAPVLAQIRRGWSVVAVNYRLLYAPGEPSAPEAELASTGSESVQPHALKGFEPLVSDPVKVPFPAALQDVAAAMKWVSSNGGSLGLNTQNVVVAGHSAGGTLAALVGLGWNSSDPVFANVPRPDGWISFSSWLDFDFPGSWQLADLLSGDSTADPRLISPLRQLDPEDPFGYVAHGDRDTVIDVHHARAAEWIYSMGHMVNRVWVDIVDVDSAGRSLSADARWHSSGDGVNMGEFEGFLDSL